MAAPTKTSTAPFGQNFSTDSQKFTFGIKEILLTFLICSVFYLFANPSIRKKIFIYFGAVQFFIFSKFAKKQNKIFEQNQIFESAMKEKNFTRKKVYFVRHGESVWNYMFNRKLNLGIFYRIFKILFFELFLLFSSADSVLLDSPLSELGEEQSRNLHDFIKQKLSPDSPHKAVLTGREKVAFLTSNLRRAFFTIFYGFKDFYNRIFIFDFLQESTRNIDGYSLEKLVNFPPVAVHTFRDGQKTLNFDIQKAQQNFCFHLFFNFEFLDKKFFIVGGHSLWFRTFFGNFLPIDHPASKFKISNGGVVAFDLCRTKSGKFFIDPKSVEVVCGNFEKKF